MIMFDIVINILEAWSISLIVSVGTRKSAIYICLQTILITLITSFYNYDNLTFVLMLFIIFSALATTYIFNKKMDISVINQVMLALLVNSFCNLLALLLMSILTSTLIVDVSANDTVFICAIIFARILNLIVSKTIYNYSFRFNVGKLYLLVTGILFIVNFIIHTLNDAVVYEMITIHTIYMLCFAFIAFSVLLVVLMLLVTREYEKGLKRQKILEQQRIVNNNLILLNSISKKISDMEHRMSYILVSVKKYLETFNYKNALDLIENYLWELKKISYFINTKNPYFDNFFSGILKKLIDNQVDPIVVCNIKRGEIDKMIYKFSSFFEVFDFFSTLLHKQNKTKISIDSYSKYIAISLIISNLTNEQRMQIEEQIQLNKDEYMTYSYYQVNDSIVEYRCVVTGDLYER